MSRVRSYVRRSVLAALLPLSGAGCTDSSEPAPIPSALSATTALEQTATVGTAVGAPPTVMVRDEDGEPLRGIPVSFTATGGGTLGQASATTGADGTASALSWTLGTAAGPQSVVASAEGLPPLTFTATARAAAPERIAVSAGADQTAPTGAALSTPPAVTIRDRYDNPVAGLPVTFEVESGGGTLTGATATTDASGRAAVGGWSLGVVPGEQRIRAVSGSLSVSIAAKAELPTGCAPAPYRLGATIPATWAESDCRSSDGTAYDEYEVTFQEQQHFRVQLSGPEARAIQVIRQSDGRVVGAMPGAAFAPPTSNPLQIEYLLEPGSYTLQVHAPSRQTSGAYTLATVPATGVVCRPITFGTAGVTLRGRIDPATDCRSPGSAEWYEDWLVMLLKTGDRLRFTMTTTEMSPLLVWRDDRLGPASPTLRVVSSPTPGTIVLEWTATFDGFHEMVISRATADTPYGAYTLTVERMP